MEWKTLKFWKSKPYKETLDYIRLRQRNKGVEIYPHKSLWFRAFDLTPFNSVKVVILGQDPYPTKGHAHGLAFSVQSTVKPIPPSLRNIFKEYQTDLGFSQPRNGDLSRWAANGVLLLNTILTVEKGRPLSHQHLGWRLLTYEAVSTLSREREAIVWMLWGNQAQDFRGAIDESKHLVIASGHPSPLATGATVPFLGSRPFTRACQYMNTQKDFWRL